MGIAGIAAAMVGAREVVMTDREERALWCALAGCKANGLRDVREMPREWNFPDDVELPKLPSFDDVEDAASPCVVSAAKVDWFEPEKAPTGFDVVLACDVLYTRRRWTPSRRWCCDCSTGTTRGARDGSCSRIRPVVSRRTTRGSWR